jgi:hypothetical protein
MTVTQQVHTSVCVSMSAFASCIWDTVERRLSYMHAGVTNATQLFNLRLYVCCYVLHGRRLSYMHASICVLCLLLRLAWEAVILHACGCDKRNSTLQSASLCLLLRLARIGAQVEMRLLLHACGCFWFFLCTKTLPILLSSSGAPRKRRFSLKHAAVDRHIIPCSV